jgi:hypothetical protein
MSGFTIPNTPDAAVADQAEPDSLDFQILGDRTNGVIHVSVNDETALKVTPSTNTVQAHVDVAPGELVINGSFHRQSSIATVLLTSYESAPFFDVIVARLTGNPASPLTFIAIPGNTPPNPRFPSTGTSQSTQVNLDTDVVLAAVYRDSSSTTINPANIIDKRTFVRSTTARLGGPTPSGGNNGDFWVDTTWTPSTTLTAANHTSSPLHVRVGATWYNIASWKADTAPAVGTAKTSGNRGEGKIVLRDSNGNFYANIIYANTFDGNATSSTLAANATRIDGRRVFVQPTQPTSGFVTGDIWFQI